MIPETLKPLAVSIDSLQPYERNPRNGDLEAIKESLESNTQYRPIVVNARDNRILAGNHTYFAAMELRWKEIAATFVDVDEEQAKRIVLVDNRTNDLAVNDDALIAEILNELPSLEGTGYTDEALDELLAGIEEREREGLTDPDAVPDVPEEPVTKRGDVWILGRHRVGCGDATAQAEVDCLLSDGPADLLFTDPPYGIGLDIRNDELKSDALDSFNTDWCVTAWASVADNAAAVIFSSTRTFPSALDAARKTGFEFLRLLTIYKPNDMTFPWRGWLLKSEAILMMQKGRARFLEVHPYAHDCYMQNHGAKTLSHDIGGHPAAKQMPVIEDLLSRLDGEKVLDLFGGSGTTLIAAEKTGRTCYMMELSENYVDVICQRFQEFSGVLPILESTGAEHDFASETSKN